MQISLQVKFRKLANLAMASEFGNALAKLARLQRIWQWCCEVGKVIANLARWLRSWQGCLRIWQGCEFR